MKKKAFLLLLLSLWVTLMGCTARDAASLTGDKDFDISALTSSSGASEEKDAAEKSKILTIDHLSALIGKTKEDIMFVLGKEDILNATSSHKAIIYGKPTDFTLEYDENGKVTRVVVALDKISSHRYIRELNNRYGEKTIDGRPLSLWSRGKIKADMKSSDKDIKLVFSKGI